MTLSNSFLIIDKPMKKREIDDPEYQWTNGRELMGNWERNTLIEKSDPFQDESSFSL